MPVGAWGSGSTARKVMKKGPKRFVCDVLELAEDRNGRQKEVWSNSAGYYRLDLEERRDNWQLSYLFPWRVVLREFLHMVMSQGKEGQG